MTIAEGTSLTGGRRDQVLAESGLADRMAQLADELTNQYVVTYSRPETADSAREDRCLGHQARPHRPGAEAPADALSRR